MSSSHDITLTPQEQALIMRLKSFRVPEMAHILEEQLKDPNADLNTFLERMTCKLCLNGMPVPLLRNCYSIFNGTKYR